MDAEKVHRATRLVRKYLANMCKNSKMRSQFPARLRGLADGRSLFRRTALCWACPWRCLQRLGGLGGDTCDGHTLSKKSQRTQNGTMFVDLD